MTTTDTIDEARVEAFAEQFLTDLAGATTTVMTVIGDRLGRYAALAGSGLVTAAELAVSTGCHPRLVTKWLANQTVSGNVTHDPTDGTYTLPPEHAMVLADPESPAYVVSAAEIVTGVPHPHRPGSGVPRGRRHRLRPVHRLPLSQRGAVLPHRVHAGRRPPRGSRWWRG